MTSLRAAAIVLLAVGSLGTAPVDVFSEGDSAEVSVEVAREGPVAGPIGAMPGAVLEAATAAVDLPLARRLDAVSAPLLGLPYLVDPLGEGTGLDPDPLARYDGFDCLTFVEEALALALAGDPAHAADVRTALRYDGAPSYASRRHFMELSWLPDAVANGWLRETTAEYGPVTTFRRDVTPGLWKAWGRRSLFALTDEQLPVGEMRLDVMSLADAAVAAPTIRPGSLVMTVREDRAWIPLWITHLGIVLEGEEGADGPRIRDASRIKSAMRTRDHALSRYVTYLGTFVNWKSAGIAVFEPVEDAPRRSRIPSDWEGPTSLVAWDDGRTSSASDPGAPSGP